MTRPDLSLVIALYFEEESVEELVRRIRQELDAKDLVYEIVFVDDGSEDRTVPLVEGLAAADGRIKLIQLSRNHGKEAAVTAGIEHAEGRAILMMDPDLQDPPDRILDFVRKLDEGYDLVFGVRQRKADTFLNSLFSRAFWSCLNVLTGLDIPKDLAVMRIFNRRFRREFLRYTERVRFIEGIFISIGMRRATLSIEHYERFAGSSKFNLRRRVTLALNAIIAFSDRPIQLVVGTGMALLGVALAAGLYLFVRKFVFDIGLSGWTSLTLTILGIGGFQLMMLGIIGNYVGKIYAEVKGRPVYAVLSTLNLPDARVPEGEINQPSGASAEGNHKRVAEPGA